MSTDIIKIFACSQTSCWKSYHKLYIFTENFVLVLSYSIQEQKINCTFLRDKQIKPTIEEWLNQLFPIGRSWWWWCFYLNNSRINIQYAEDSINRSIVQLSKFYILYCHIEIITFIAPVKLLHTRTKNGHFCISSSLLLSYVVHFLTRAIEKHGEALAIANYFKEGRITRFFECYIELKD